MFENVVNFFKGLGKNKDESKSKGVAKERLHLVLMQDRANISADFLALMKQEIIEVIKDVDENAIDVRLTNKENSDGTTGAPVLYANIPIVSVKEEAKEEARKIQKENNTSTKEQVQEKEKKDDNEDKKEVKEEKAQEVIEKAEEIVEEVKEEAKESNSQKE